MLDVDYSVLVEAHHYTHALVIFTHVCSHIWAHVGMCKHVHICVEAWRWHHMFLSSYALYLLRQDLTMSLRFPIAASTASPLTPAIFFVSWTLGLQAPAMRAWLLHGFWEIGAVSQLSESSALLTQHVPSSCLNIWNRILLYKPETDMDFVLQHVAELIYRVGVVRCTRVSRKTTQNVL